MGDPSGVGVFTLVSSALNIATPSSCRTSFRTRRLDGTAARKRSLPRATCSGVARPESSEDAAATSSDCILRGVFARSASLQCASVRSTFVARPCLRKPRSHNNRKTVRWRRVARKDVVSP